MKLSSAVNIADLRTLAKRRLPRVIFDFMDGGAEDEVTLRANCEGFARYRFRPRLLTANDKRDLSISLFGQKFSLPFMVAPTGLNGIHWRHADIALASAAAKAGAGFALSTASTDSIEDVGAATSGTKWFQLYPWADRAFCARMLERARGAGYKTLLVTVDSVIAGRRERDARHRFAHEVTLTPSVVLDGLMHPDWLLSVWLAGGGMPKIINVAEFLPPGARAADMAEFTRARRNPLLNWDDMAFIKKAWGGPMLIKGVLTAEDTRLALEHGADGVVVSNHGGRQLDGSVATIEALPEIVDAAGDAVVMIDGGFRRGSDIVKALALGAKGVLVGRATLFGVAAAGEAGASRAIDILRVEVDRVLALLGCRSIAELGPRHVVTVDELNRSSRDAGLRRTRLIDWNRRQNDGRDGRCLRPTMRKLKGTAMSEWTRKKPRGELPRLVTPNLLWTGGCLSIEYRGEVAHGHFSTYLVAGSEKTMLVDTGHASHWRAAEKHVEEFLDGRPLDYVFPTHAEFPHGGLAAHWMKKYPNAICVGDIPEYPLYWPDLAPRIRQIKVGDEIDLGDRKMVFVPAIWRDLRSLWAFETVGRVLFVSDGFSYLHYHKAGQCDFMTSEHAPPDVGLIQFFNERALRWTRYTDTRETFADIDEMLKRLDPLMIAAAHGGVIDTPDMIPLLKSGMLMGQAGIEAKITKLPSRETASAGAR